MGPGPQEGHAPRDQLAGLVAVGAHAGGDGQDRAAWQQISANLTREFGFGSAHPGTVNAVMGDGSTQVIAITADIYLLRSIGARADGGIVSLDDL